MTQNDWALPQSSSQQVRHPRVELMFHPGIQVPDIEDTQQWLKNVFGAASSWTWTKPGAITNTKFGYATLIRDLHINPMCPALLLMDGKRVLDPVEKPHLWITSWYVEDSKMTDIYREMHRLGFRTLDRLMQPCAGDTPPLSPGPVMAGSTSGRPSFMADADDAGLQFYFVPVTVLEDGSLQGHMEADYRAKPGWKLPPRDEAEPLGLEWVSHHTILTRQLERRLQFMIDVLGGTVISEGRDELRGTTCTYVHLADAIIEYAVPDPGTDAWADWKSDISTRMNGRKTDRNRREPNDTYHAITWKVVDLDRATAHLEANGVRIRSRSDDTIITAPETSLGIPWGFTTRRIPGDPR